MTGPGGNSEFCFPRISMFPETRSIVEGDIEIRGKQNSLFPKGPVICYIAKQNKTKANFEKRVEIPATLGHL